MALRVRLTPRAIGDLEGIRAYLLARSPKGADRVRASIDRSIRTLARHPGLGRVSTIPGVLQIATARYGYIIYYTIVGDELIIIHIRHGARGAPTREDLSV